jgi:hypothetical protein
MYQILKSRRRKRLANSTGGRARVIPLTRYRDALFRCPMPRQRITMHKVKEVLRLWYVCSLSLDAIARALSLSKGVVVKYVKSAAQANLGWTRRHWPIGWSLNPQPLLLPYSDRSR